MLAIRAVSYEVSRSERGSRAITANSRGDDAMPGGIKAAPQGDEGATPVQAQLRKSPPNQHVSS